MSEYTELKNLITGLAGTVSSLGRKIAALEAKAHAPHSAPAPAPAPRPAPGPLLEHVIVARGDYASKWFGTEAALLALNPDFKTLAYRSDGSIMRRFTKRGWGDIYPPERLRVK